MDRCYLSSRAAFAVAGLLVVMACGTAKSPEDPGLAEATATSQVEDIFRRHCALCHGVEGSGKGRAAALLYPPARDFWTGRFSLVSTDNGVPSDADIEKVLERGMPGSAMPSFAWMPADTRRALARHVRRLSIDGIARRLEHRAEVSGNAMESEAAQEIATELMTPGNRVDPVQEVAVDDQVLARGKEIYGRHCAACHGADGKGRGSIRAWRNEFEMHMARDFTAGVLKGPATRDELAARIVAGMPGSGMPPTEFQDPADAGALLAFVESLIPEGVSEKLVQRRQRIVARRVDELPTKPDAAAWSSATESSLVFAPLSWSENAALFASVSAVHDGKHLAIRLRWKDDSRDASPIASDGAAIQFSTDREPPLFGMGSRGRPVNIWHWKAARLRDVEGKLDLMSPHARRDPMTGEHIKSDAPLYLPTPRLKQKSSKADSMRVTGAESMAHAESSLDRVAAAPMWSNGEWQVVFRRSLEPKLGGEVALTPGAELQIGFATWNGAGNKSLAFKSVTIWHGLAIER